MNRISDRFRVIPGALAFVALVIVLCLAARPVEAQQRSEKELIEIISSDASSLAKDQACRELQIVGTKACVPALEKQLLDQDGSHMARYVLESMALPEAGQALRAALSRAQGPAKIGIINSLGFRRDAQAAGALIGLLRDNDPKVVEATIAALGRIATMEAIDALGEFNETAPAAYTAVLAEAGLTAAQEFLAQGDLETAAAIYGVIMSSEKFPAHARLGAFVGALKAAPDQASDMIVAAINSEDDVLRSTVIAHVGDLDDDAVIARLAEALPTASTETRIQLITALADAGGAAARAAVVRSLQDADAGARLAALTALGTIGNASTVPALVDVLAKSDERDIRNAALLSLEVLQGEGADAALLKAIAEANASDRADLIGLLVARKSPGAVEALLKWTQAQDTDTREAAWKALGRLAQPEDLRPMLRLLAAMTGEAGRADAERALTQVSRTIADPEGQADPVLQAFGAMTSKESRASVLNILGGIGGEKALQAVTRVLNGADTDLQDVALRSLVSWPDSGAVPVLLEIYQGATNATRRTLALRGCVRLLSAATASDAPSMNSVRTYGALMADAKDAEEKKLILGGLGQSASLGALRLATPCLDDSDVRAEAELAVIAIAQSVAAVSPTAVQAVARRLAEESTNENIKKQATDLLATIERFEDYIVSWRLAGPYSREGRAGNQLVDESFAPEKAGEDVAWKILNANAASERPWMLDLAQALGGDNCVAYAVTGIYSPRAQKAQLEIGADDGIKVFLNGEEIYQNNSAGPAVPGEEKVALQLREGRNQLMLKVIQHTAGWEFCARLRAEDGSKLDDVRVGGRGMRPRTRRNP